MEAYLKKGIRDKKDWILWGIRIFLLAMYLFSFTTGKFWIRIVFIGLIIMDVFRKKSVQLALDVFIAVFLVISSRMWLSNWYERLDEVRFRILSPRYEQTAENLLIELREAEPTVSLEGTGWESLRIQNPFLSEHSEIEYSKDGESTVLYFVTYYNGGFKSGYAYVSGEGAYELLQGRIGFDYAYRLQGNWFYFMLY